MTRITPTGADGDHDWPYYGYSEEHVRNRTPLDRFGTLEEVANCATFLAAGDHYVTGAVLHGDGGWLAFGWAARGEVTSPPVTTRTRTPTSTARRTALA